jgi:hypothetical protein
VQALPHLPQLELSVCRFLHAEEQHVLAEAGQTLPQAPQLLLSCDRSLQALVQQVFPLHWTLQAPQLFGSLRMLRQL